jgi:RNA polymerase sigma-70 factor, ECF subfamily
MQTERSSSSAAWSILRFRAEPVRETSRYAPPKRYVGDGATNSAESVEFDGIFERVYPQLFRFVHRLTGDVDAAEDVAQESFVRLLSRPMPEEDAKRWLFRVATNLVRDGVRAANTRQRLTARVPGVSSLGPPQDERVERDERIAAVRSALDALSERDKRLLLMREEGFRYDEIAEAIGVAPTSVGTLLARATKRFTAVYRGEETVDAHG